MDYSDGVKIKKTQDFTNETLLSTPEPAASSTTQKQQLIKKLQLQKIPLVYSPNTSKVLSSSTESLGILCMDNVQLTPELDARDNQNIKCSSQITSKNLQQERELVNNLLQESTKRLGLSSRYFKPSDTIRSSVCSTVTSNSTVNETDLLQSVNECQSLNEIEALDNTKEKISFAPDDISTPRTSCTSNRSSSCTSSLDRSGISSNNSMSHNLALLAQQVRNPDLSIAELFERFQRLSAVNDNCSQLEYNEESFVAGELAAAKIAEQERSWQREHDIFGGNARTDSIFSQMNFSNQQESNISEFFRKKSELADLCLKDSPEKDSLPVPLIDDSLNESVSSKLSDISTMERSELLNTPKIMKIIDNSALSITEIENLISKSDNRAKRKEMSKRDSTEFKKNRKPSGYVPMSDSIARIEDYIGKISSKRTSKENYAEFKENLKPLGHANAGFNACATPAKDSKSVLKDVSYFDNTIDKSSNSMHTASSLDSLPSGKLPIETNRIELIWGCVRVGKRKIQQFILRNRSQNKLRLQISSSNTNFRILTDLSDLDSVSNLPILMYPSESRAFNVVFTPTSIGAVVGKLNFSPISDELKLQQTKRQQLMMFAYGGHSNLEIENVLKDANMKLWLSLGKLDTRQQLSRTFTIYNVGNVPAFGCLSYSAKALYGYSKVIVYPMELVLQPKERTTVTVTYIPTKEDAKHLFGISASQVMEIGFIQIITGEESVRGRIRRLCRKLKQESGVVSNPLIERLSNKFPNEKMPSDLNQFTETVASVKELMQTFGSREIILTLEKDSENTLLGQIGGIDETSMFQSLSEGMTTVMCNKTLVGSCTVEPNKLLLAPPGKIEDCILISSQSTLQFQIDVTPPEVLKINPCEGILVPGETTLIKVSCSARYSLQQPQVFKVSIYVDDEVSEVEVKVKTLSNM